MFRVINNLSCAIGIVDLNPSSICSVADFAVRRSDARVV